ncbi:MAG: hypothetical protein HYT61_02170 [Candidatus Yanofskybacteria bacterium]|nr:hypothetical protein [Candidatus Yanofskybacteria bacterium]
MEQESCLIRQDILAITTLKNQQTKTLNLKMALDEAVESMLQDYLVRKFDYTKKQCFEILAEPSARVRLECGLLQELKNNQIRLRGYGLLSYLFSFFLIPSFFLPTILKQNRTENFVVLIIFCVYSVAIVFSGLFLELRKQLFFDKYDSAYTALEKIDEATTVSNVFTRMIKHLKERVNL